MTIHLLKLSVGSESVDTLAAWQRDRLQTIGRLYHRTRHKPRRAAELIVDGSIYWVIKGVVLVRQRVVGVEDAADSDGSRCCHLMLDPTLVRTVAQPRRPHQGWRYLEPADAPADLPRAGDDARYGEPPPKMAAALRELGLI